MIDNVNHPKHYTQGGIECIDALKAATVGKTGIEAVCVANVIKYCWRYEEKKENCSFIGPDDVVDDCNECANYNIDEDSEPCCNCKNTAVPGTPEYDKRPLLFKWSN